MSEREIRGREMGHLITTLRAPRGVTRIAGTKAYAPKLHISPKPTVKFKFNNSLVVRRLVNKESLQDLNR
jgi:hypothetical protein